MGRYNPEYISRRNQEPMTVQSITQAIQDNEILEARVISCNDEKTITLELGKNIFGEIKAEEFEYRIDGQPVNTRSIDYSVYKHIKFIPLSMSKDNGIYKVECSRRKAQEECYNNFIKKLTPGDIVDATVVRITSYGVFCDIGCGIKALLPNKNISVTHVVNPESFIGNIYNLKVIIKSIDEDGKITLSHKELLGTWKEEAANINKGDIICGTVLSIEDYGIFVRISQNLAGLADIPTEDIKVGDKVLVRITFIKEENMKIKMTIVSKLSENNKDNLGITKFKYRITEGHITDWKYSTDTATKQISSHF